MIFDWFRAREVVEAGIALADKFAPPAMVDAGMHRKKTGQNKALPEFLRQAEQQVRSLRLNFYKKAKLASSFKWRLIENGIANELADQVTRDLVVHLSLNKARTAAVNNQATAQANRPLSVEIRHLFSLGNKHLEQGAYGEAVATYETLLQLDSGHTDALNNLGSALCKLGRYREAEIQFRQAIEVRPDYPEAHANLGTVLRWRGEIAQSEISLRRALKLKPTYVEARTSLGLTLAYLGRLRDAKARFEKVLKTAPRNVDALFGMGQVAKMEGRFEAATGMFNRVLEVDPKMPSAWAALAGLRKMTASDGDWVKRAQEIAETCSDPLQEADLRFALGKCYDDMENFEQAFQNISRANDLQKAIAETYDRKSRTRFVDDLSRAYTSETIGRAVRGATVSAKPVFVVGMMRSGTSLAEQIIASHPLGAGAGELAYWANAVQENETVIRQGRLSGELREKLSAEYLRTLEGYSTEAQRIVDKTPVNSDYLGVIHSVFPNARIIYMRRDPIDTCLSCYFQQFSAALNFTMDMSDLAHYYREHQRLMRHWRSVLPPGSILDVPYAELVADQELWTRKILDFIGLEWDERCLDFHKTQRPVLTASYWQVRQKIYNASIGRWRKYKRYVGPLLSLEGLDS